MVGKMRERNNGKILEQKDVQHVLSLFVYIWWLENIFCYPPFSGGSGTQACFRVAHFLEAQLQCHHRASKLLPLLAARFGEMDFRLCFLDGW